MEEKIYVVGKVVAIFFQNPSNFFKVLLIALEETNADYHEKEIVVTGSFGEIQEEESYRFSGEMIEHPRYGEQLKVESYQQAQPTSEHGLILYLSSDKFPGIGKKTAEAIVNELGEQAIDRIIEDPSVLERVRQLNEKKRKQLVETLRINYGMDQIVVGLAKYGFGSQLSFAIYQCYKNEALEIIEENPYQLVEDIEGIGFKKADAIAEQLGIEATSKQRIRAAVIHQIFEECTQSGNTYTEAQRLLEVVLELLENSRQVEISPQLVADVMIELVEEGKIKQEETRLYENSLYFSEWGIANSFEKFLNGETKDSYSDEKLDKTLRIIEKRSKIIYGSSQEQAIKEALKSPVFILTGGPGTGKTTVINGIVQMFAELNDVDLDVSRYTTEQPFPILLAAPTGRAAKRMNETTGLPSGTIHRLLGLNGREDNSEVETRTLEGGLLIVDEMSMVDTWLANTLFKSIPSGMQVILVGDKDQLPSVGPGQVLHDLLEITAIPQLELTEIYRQGDGSSIISLAHEIKKGQLPSDLTKKQIDRSFIRCDAFLMEQAIEKIVLRAKEKGFSAQEIQVLAPMYRGPAGINALNQMMQRIFNPAKPGRKEVKHLELVYRIGDKVLQLVNAPEHNVFNGDMGEIVGITYAKDSEDKVDELVIQFDNSEVVYKRNEWQQITLAYCCSIHKAQGSEFKMVILPMVHQYHRMLQRNLLYTAITRSKEILILLGEESAYRECVDHQSHTRLTTLTFRIHQKLSTFLDNNHTEKPVQEVQIEQTNQEEVPEVLPSKQETSEQAGQPMILTMAMIQQQIVDPLIGMEEVTPYQFLSNETN